MWFKFLYSVVYIENGEGFILEIKILIFYYMGRYVLLLI